MLGSLVKHQSNRPGKYDYGVNDSGVCCLQVNVCLLNNNQSGLHLGFFSRRGGGGGQTL